MTTKSKTETPSAPTPAAAPAPRKTYVEVIRPFSGLAAGEVIDATSWLHTASLVESRYVRVADKDLVSASLPCSSCRKRWVDEFFRDHHDCADDPDTE